jgi:hypothetical protein
MRMRGQVNYQFRHSGTLAAGDLRRDVFDQFEHLSVLA